MRAALCAGVLSLAVMVDAAVKWESYDVTVTLKDSSVLAVPFLECPKDQIIPPSAAAPERCKERDQKTFPVAAARITNMGTNLVWVYVDQAKFPIGPGEHIWRTAVGNNGFDRVFISGEPGGVVHVYAVQNPQVIESLPPR